MTPVEERIDPLDVGALEAIHARVAHALEAAYEQLSIAQDAELALRNYEAARKHDFNLKECETTLLEALAALPATKSAQPEEERRGGC